MTAADNAMWRQTLSFWEMAASLVLRGTVDPDLFFDSNGEGVLIYAKFHHFHAETEKESGNIFMQQTAALIAQYPAATALYERFLPMFGPKS
jgi:beta-xylosidase